MTNHRSTGSLASRNARLLDTISSMCIKLHGELLFKNLLFRLRKKVLLRGRCFFVDSRSSFLPSPHFVRAEKRTQTHTRTHIGHTYTNHTLNSIQNLSLANNYWKTLQCRCSTITVNSFLRNSRIHAHEILNAIRFVLSAACFLPCFFLLVALYNNCSFVFLFYVCVYNFCL